MSDKNARFLLIIGAIITVFVISFVALRKIFNDSNVEKRDPLFKNYKVNEYIPTHVTDNDMARIYLTDYIYILMENRIEAYYLLDKSYRESKYPTLDSFNEYISSIDLSNVEIDKYYKTFSKNYIIFGVYDKEGNFYAFKTQGVMQYSVYLDDYTVEIGD